MLSWTDGNTVRLLAGESEVNIGNIVAAIGWTILVVGAALLIVIFLGRRSGGRPLQYLTGVDGHLSLAMTQVACWTVVVGGVVLGYGLVRLQIPDIPASLLVLMGASLATGGIAYFQDTKQQAGAVAAGQHPSTYKPALGDLVAFSRRDRNPNSHSAKRKCCSGPYSCS